MLMRFTVCRGGPRRVDLVVHIADKHQRIFVTELAWLLVGALLGLGTSQYILQVRKGLRFAWIAEPATKDLGTLKDPVHASRGPSCNDLLQGDDGVLLMRQHKPTISTSSTPLVASESPNTQEVDPFRLKE